MVPFKMVQLSNSMIMKISEQPIIWQQVSACKHGGDDLLNNIKYPVGSRSVGDARGQSTDWFELT